MFRRRRRAIKVIVRIGEDDYPAWALRAGHVITRTDFDHGARRLAVTVDPHVVMDVAGLQRERRAI